MLKITDSIIAFDCGGTHLNTTTISLLSVGEFNLQFDKPTATDIYVQLLQLSSYSHTEVIQCKVELSRAIYYCGMHSHISIVQNGQASYIVEITHEKCLQMHKEGLIRIGSSNIIDRLRSNSTHYRSVTLAGKVGVNGICKDAQFADHYDTWDDVLVQAQLKISLRTAYVPVHLENGHIILKSGTSCILSDGHCIDADDGYTFWQPIPKTACNFN